MNYEYYIENLKDLAGFSVWVALLLVPIVAALKTNIPSLLGWKTLLVSFTVGCLITGGLTRPDNLQLAIDSILVGSMAALIAVGGDSYLFRIVRKFKSPGSEALLKLIGTISDEKKNEEQSASYDQEEQSASYDQEEQPTKKEV